MQISLKLLSGADFDIREIMTKWHENLANYYEVLKNSKKELLEEYLSKLYMRGVPANYLINDHFIKATIEGVDKYGLLVLHDKRGKKYTCGLKEIVYPEF